MCMQTEDGNVFMNCVLGSEIGIKDVFYNVYDYAMLISRRSDKTFIHLELVFGRNDR
jgi:hypothetical protein